jgi:NADH dehydrogenase/NADH:ubiquinone oxidoreductase subunit G
VKELAPDARSFEQLIADIVATRVTHVIALGGATPRESADDLGTLKSLRGLVTVATNEGPLSQTAHVVLPAASWAETSGTYVNAKGMKQRSEKAIDLLGAARPGWEQVAELATALGYETTWTKLKDIRARLGLAPEPVNARAGDSLGPTNLGASAD